MIDLTPCVMRPANDLQSIVIRDAWWPPGLVELQEFRRSQCQTD